MDNMARAQKKKAGSPKKKKTSAKVASPKGEKSKEDAIIDLSQTGSPLRKFSKNLSEYKPSWEVNGGFSHRHKKIAKSLLFGARRSIKNPMRLSISSFSFFAPFKWCIWFAIFYICDNRYEIRGNQ